MPTKPGPKGAWKLTDDIVEQIVALDAQGLTQARIAEQVGVSSFSVRQVLRERAAAGAEPSPQVGDHTEDLEDPSDDADAGQGCRLPVVPAPTPRTGERQAARFGQLVQAEPVFTEGRQLPLAGLLLRNGFYGLRSVLLTLVLLALLREPRAEGATRVVPADLGHRPSE